MFCPKCGLQQPDASNFCQRCGQDLSEKREKLGEISAGAIKPASRQQEQQKPVQKQAPAQQTQQVPYNNSPMQGPPAPQYVYPPPQYVIQHIHQAPQQKAPAAPKRKALPHLGLRRLLCVLTFLASMGIGVIYWLLIKDELIAYLEYGKLPTFNTNIAVAIVSIVILGIIESLIGMGTIYSKASLTVAFVMSTICAILSLLNIPGGWSVRLTAFGLFAVCGLLEAISAMEPGTMKRKPKTPKAPQEQPNQDTQPNTEEKPKKKGFFKKKEK